MVSKNWRLSWIWCLVAIVSISALYLLLPAQTARAAPTNTYGRLDQWPTLDYEFCQALVRPYDSDLVKDEINDWESGSIRAYDNSGGAVSDCMRNLGVDLVDIPIPSSLESYFNDPRGWPLPGQQPASATPGYYISQLGARVVIEETEDEETIEVSVAYFDIDGQGQLYTKRHVTNKSNGSTTEETESNPTYSSDASDAGGINPGGTPSQTTASGGTGGGGNDDEDSGSLGGTGGDGCADQAGLNWAFCGMLWGISNGIEVIERQVYRELRIDRTDYQPKECDPAKYTTKEDIPRACNYNTAWKNMRNLMTLAIVGTAIVMVVATALDFGWFSNYTVKKYLARLIAGTILMIASWAIGDLIIAFANGLGGFAGAAITAPFGGETGAASIGLDSIFKWSPNEGNLVAAGATAGAGVAIGIVALSGGLGIVPVLLTAALGMLAILAGFLFLIFRQVVIIALLVFAPVGVALWFLPGSDKMWRLYYKTFLSLVFIYPVIVSVIAFGRVFIWVLLQSEGGAKDNSLIIIIAFLVYVGMFLAIPVLFKKFLGAINQLTGSSNNPAKGLFDRLKNTRKGYMDQAKAIRKTARSAKEDEDLARIRKKQKEARDAGLHPNALLTDAEKLKMKGIETKRRISRGLPATSSSWTTRQSTRSMSDLIMAAEEGERHKKVVDQWSAGGLDSKFGLDAGDFPTYNKHLEQIAEGKDPTGEGRKISMAEQEGALRKLAQHKQDVAFRNLSAKRANKPDLSLAWNNLVRDGTMFKEFDGVADDVARNLVYPGEFDISGMPDKSLQTQTKDTIENLGLSYDRMLGEAKNQRHPSSAKSYQKLDMFAKQVERLLDNKMARNNMPTGTYEALEKIKTKHDQSIGVEVEQQVNKVSATATSQGWNDQQYNLELSTMANNVDETLTAETDRRAAIEIAANNQSHEAVMRQVCYSSNPVIQSSLKQAVKADTLKKGDIAIKAPHIASLEVDDDGNLGKLEDVDWLKLGLDNQQLGQISTASAQDMSKWFADKLPEARTDTVLRRNIKNYSSKHIAQAAVDAQASNPALAQILQQVHDNADRL